MDLPVVWCAWWANTDSNDYDNVLSAGADYVTASMDFTFTRQDALPCLRITIRNDNLFESGETLHVQLRNTNSITGLNAMGQAAVRILDDEGKDYYV